MNLGKLISEKKEDIIRVASQYGAQKVKVFGSVLKGKSTGASDLDLLVEMKPGSTLLDIIAIKQDLEDMLGCKVDIATRASLSPYIREDVLKEALVL